MAKNARIMESYASHGSVFQSSRHSQIQGILNNQNSQFSGDFMPAHPVRRLRNKGGSAVHDLTNITERLDKKHHTMDKKQRSIPKIREILLDMKSKRSGLASLNQQPHKLEREKIFDIHR